MSRKQRHSQEDEASLGEAMAILGQIYLVILVVLILGLASIDRAGLARAAGALRFIRSTAATNFTA